MNSKLREILEKLYDNATVAHKTIGINNAKSVDVPRAEKAIRQAVAEEMLELVGEDDPFEQYLTSSKKSVGRQLKNKNRNDFRAELRQKIKEWSEADTQEQSKEEV